MKSKLIFTLSIFCLSLLFLVTSCKKKEDEVLPQEGFGKILGTYSGTYKNTNTSYSASEVDWALVIGEKAEPYGIPPYALANILDFPYIIKLDNLSASDGKVVGRVEIYKYLDEISKDDSQISGYGNFSYEKGRISLIWTASSINGAWSVNYQSK